MLWHGSTYEKRERNERHPRDSREGEDREEGKERGGIKGMDEWMEVWLQPCRERSLYSRQEFEHSIVCFGKIRDGTAKASRAQFTLLNRRNGLEASDEHRLFPRYSAFKLSFRAVHLSLSLSSSLSPFLFNLIFNSRNCVSTSIFWLPASIHGFSHVAR